MLNRAQVHRELPSLSWTLSSRKLTSSPPPCPYQNGHHYFWALSEILENAKETIFIADWWLTPELYLRRPPEAHPEFRLDRLLLRKAQQGVDIYVMVYKEVVQSMSMSSAHTKHHLEDLHERIRCVRHPDHLGGEVTLFYSHHEKIVVVDNLVACIGGLDMCVPLSLALSSSSSTSSSAHSPLGETAASAGGTRAPSRSPTCTRPTCRARSSPGRTSTTRASRTLSRSTSGPPTTRRAPRRRGCHGTTSTPCSSGRPFSTSRSTSSSVRLSLFLSSSLPSLPPSLSPSFPLVLLPLSTLPFRLHHTARWPFSSGVGPSASSYARPRRRRTDPFCPFLLPPPSSLSSSPSHLSHRSPPRSSPSLLSLVALLTFRSTRPPPSSPLPRARAGWNFICGLKYRHKARYPLLAFPHVDGLNDGISRHPHFERLKEEGRHYFCHHREPGEEGAHSPPVGGTGLKGSARAQVLRSASDWSHGVHPTEASIQAAYCQMIAEAKSFVLLSNQFFITSASSDPKSPVKNLIGQAIVQRVLSAHKRREKFKVVIIIPAIPGFAGDLYGNSGTLAILGAQYFSLSRGGNSIFEVLEREGVTASDYIEVYNLRSFDRLNYDPERIKRMEEASGVTLFQAQAALARCVLPAARTSSCSPS